MEKPPQAGVSKEKELAKKQQETLKKIQDQEKAKLKLFREKIEKKLDTFIQDDTQLKLVFDPMEKMFRSIIHDVSDVAGLNAFSFGIEDVDRHTVIFKKEGLPCDDELEALRKGESYDPEKARLKRVEEEEEERERMTKPKKNQIVPNSNFMEKYEHLVGKDAGKSAAHVMTTNKQFGFVSSENKRDQRSIEQTLADMAKKKKLKVEATSSEGPEDGPSNSAPDNPS
jgi:hypothetical protein